jgi:hypothetical protein
MLPHKRSDQVPNLIESLNLSPADGTNHYCRLNLLLHCGRKVKGHIIKTMRMAIHDNRGIAFAAGCNWGGYRASR